ncbi:MAG: hypothetical protein CR971_01175, partial [candidate division SR1 bacterium]
IVWTANTYAQDEVDFAIIPKSEGLDGNEIKDIAKGGSVWDNYNKAAQRIGKGDTGTADQIQSGIMDWDTLLNYIVYLAQFIGELGLLIAAFVFIYIGYEKASKVFSFGEGFIGSVTKGLIVIIGAYFIVKFLYNAFMS